MKRWISVAGLLGLAGTLLIFPGRTADGASGDSGPGVSTAKPAIFYPPHDVAFDRNGRGWFTTISRRFPTAGSAEDRRCGPENNNGVPLVDRWGCGRIGRFGPVGVTYFGSPGMLAPWTVEIYGNTPFVSDSEASVIWRVQANGTVSRAVETFAAPAGTPASLVDRSKALRPTEMLRVGNRIWYVAVDWDGQRTTAGPARVRQIGRIGYFRADRPSIRRSWRVSNLRNLSGLALDAQGRLWFTAPGPDDGAFRGQGIGFGRLNPSAPNPFETLQVFRQEQFPPDAVYNPTRIIRGPDDQMWYIDNGRKEICRLSPAAPTSTQECFPRGGDGQPYDLVIGSDDAVWYTDAAQDRLGRVTVAGVKSFVEVPQPFDSPWGIAVGRDSAGALDGRLFVAAAASGQIPWYEP